MTALTAKMGVVVLALCLWGFTWDSVWATPTVEHWETEQGARVYFIRTPALPIVDLRVIFDAGSARDGDRRGLAVLTNRLLDEGVRVAEKELSAGDIAQRFAKVGARFSSYVDRDKASVTLRSLTDPDLLQPALDTLALVLKAPAFPVKGLKRERERMEVTLREQRQSPGALAERAFYRAIYGEHPYAHPPLGTLESVPKLRRSHVRTFYERYYGARNAIIVIVGALEREAAERVAETAVGGLRAGSRAPPLAEVPLSQANRDAAIHYPSAQTHILMGQVGMARGDPDYFPLLVGNHVLGGNGLVSRLAEEVREQRGLSYRVYSKFRPMREAGPFVVGLQTRNSQAETALYVLRKNLERFVRKGPTEEELKLAQKNLTGGFPLRFDSNRGLLEQLTTIGFYGLPLDFLDTYTKRIQEVTVKGVQKAFQQHVHPKRLSTVIAGGAVQEGGILQK